MTAYCTDSKPLVILTLSIARGKDLRFLPDSLDFVIRSDPDLSSAE
jgi:hypothetical protein